MRGHGDAIDVQGISRWRREGEHGSASPLVDGDQFKVAHHVGSFGIVVRRARSLRAGEDDSVGVGEWELETPGEAREARLRASDEGEGFELLAGFVGRERREDQVGQGPFDDGHIDYIGDAKCVR